MRVAVLGNSGSGKSTLARWIAGYTYAPLLDLDTVVWEPGKIAVARSPEAARSDLHAFCSAKNHWIIEGCYASLVNTGLSTHRSSFFSTQVKANASVTAVPDLGKPTSTHHAQSKMSSWPSCSPGSVNTTRGTGTWHSRDIRHASTCTLAAKSRLPSHLS